MHNILDNAHACKSIMHLGISLTSYILQRQSEIYKAWQNKSKPNCIVQTFENSFKLAGLWEATKQNKYNVDNHLRIALCKR